MREILHTLTNRNARWRFTHGFFFRFAMGCLGVPVTERCSIATDKSLFPRGCLAFVDTRAPLATASGEPAKARWRHFALDQDSGGAIRAAGRADIYVGIGDQAGRIAGWMLDEGRLYYLFLK